MKYIPTDKPNSEALRELIEKAKGSRSMAKFAEDIKLNTPNIKVSAPTLSRAMNWMKDKPVSVDLLEAIAKTTENSEVTLDKLIEANGMRSKEEDIDLIKKDEYAQRIVRTERVEKRVKMIIQNEIAGRNYPFQQLHEFSNWHHLHGYKLQQDRFFPRNYTFGFSVSGMSPGNTWKFALDHVQLSNDDGNSAEAHVGNFINKVGAVFASDSFESEYYETEKYSFVFIDEKLFNLFLKRINDHEILVNGLMTAILVDFDEGCVVEETQLKRYDEAEAASFFKIPISEKLRDIELIDPFDIVD